MIASGAPSDGDAPRADRLVVVTDTPALRRLKVLPGEYHPRFVRTWAELRDAVENAFPSSTVVADPYLGREAGEGPAPELRELLAWRPSVPVVAALSLRADRSGDAATLFEWGVSDLLDLELESGGQALHGRLRGTRARPLKRRVEAEWSPYASEYARNLMRAACEAAVDGGGAPELAKMFRVEPRTVAAWCAREGLPMPRRLLAWMRVMLSATLLEEGRSVVNASRGAGYATDHALRRAMRELIGGDPSSLQRMEIFPLAIRTFNEELWKLREEARQRKRPLATGRPSPLYG
jgi:methylphosphotriester-DNA--protein-cysteine methyltransferase